MIASSTAAGILLFFIVVGELVLLSMGVPLLAFQIAGGIVLFLFALTMIFGESKPEGETEMLQSVQDTGLILASIAATHVLEGAEEYFQWGEYHCTIKRNHAERKKGLKILDGCNCLPLTTI